MEETLKDVTISTVFDGGSGEGQYGPWQRWDCYVDGDKRKFAYFEKDDFIPVKGMYVRELRVVSKQVGDKTYWNVDKFIMPSPKEEKARLSDAPQSTNSNRDISFYVSYAKDTAIALIQQFPEQYKGATLEQICDQITFAGQRMCKMATGQGEPITDDIEIPKLGLNPDDDYPPFDESAF